MVASSFERSITLVFGHEGGYVNDPADPGGPTKYGITQKTLSAWRGKPVSAAEVQGLTLAEASKILQAQYWRPVRGNDLSSGVDHAMFDYAVNSGPAQAAKTLQRIVGVEVDGIIGARTLAAANNRTAAQLIDALCDARLVFLRGLRTWKRFGKGWASRVERVRREAKGLLNGSIPLHHSASVSGAAQARTTDQKTSSTREGQGAALAGIGVLGAACADAGRQIAPYADSFPVMGWLFLILTAAGIGIGLYATLKRIRKGEG